MAASADSVLEQQIQWIRDAAGDRLPNIEIELISFLVKVSNSRQAAAEELAAMFATWPAHIIAKVPNAEQILTSQQSLIGSVGQIVETIQALRERYGISYMSVGSEAIDSFSPVVARLTGT